MRNKIEIFKNEELGNVRTLFINNECWFIGKDVAECLGYKDTSDSLRTHVDEDDKGVGEIPTPGGKQQMILINESGMYSLIFSSKLEKAKKFKRWVTKEVLPSIRQHGLYITDELLQNQQLLEDKISELKYDNKRLIEEKSEIEKQNKEYLSQEHTLFTLSIQTGINKSYLPSLTVQILRNFLKSNNNLIIDTKDNYFVLKNTPVLNEMKKLIINKNDRQKILYIVGVKIIGNLIYIPTKFLDENYIPLESCLNYE
ncbi:Bro-N domain-containing protein [uncultured Clostridium sp.]|uniref:BRO-N domain-containing protein n=1 Tax=uncultured Clostridium sp. TaxID=59620 RepID=UPI0025DCB1F7|nr:Bro-N domain-containing protein [uncultured Clostridium sp.]